MSVFYILYSLLCVCRFACDFVFTLLAETSAEQNVSKVTDFVSSGLSKLVSLLKHTLAAIQCKS